MTTLSDSTTTATFFRPFILVVILFNSFFILIVVPLTTNTHVDLELSAISRFEMELFFLSILTTLSKKNRMGEKKRGRMEWNPFVCRRHVVKIVDSLPRIPAQPGNIGPSLISFVAGI